MSNRKSEKDSEIWLKYCEDCVKSKLENNDEHLFDSSNKENIKKLGNASYSK
ncbi:MAG: hypothetical protein ACFFBH_01635 [Promethearchaeota archaeon]